MSYKPLIMNGYYYPMEIIPDRIKDVWTSIPTLPSEPIRPKYPRDALGTEGYSFMGIFIGIVSIGGTYGTISGLSKVKDGDSIILLFFLAVCLIGIYFSFIHPLVIMSNIADHKEQIIDYNRKLADYHRACSIIRSDRQNVQKFRETKMQEVLKSVTKVSKVHYSLKGSSEATFFQYLLIEFPQCIFTDLIF